MCSIRDIVVWRYAIVVIEMFIEEALGSVSFYYGIAIEGPDVIFEMGEDGYKANGLFDGPVERDVDFPRSQVEEDFDGIVKL